MDTPRLAASKAGKSRYHGQPCKRCGGTERQTRNATCVVCHKLYAQRYRKKINAPLDALKAAVQVEG
jgi:uncharacterized paraquat-inducible protein A